MTAFLTMFSCGTKASGTELDREKTLRTLARPPSSTHQPFIALGEGESVFEYRGVFYIDLFFSADTGGDFVGGRVSDPHLQDTLAVLLRKKDRTQQICELELTDP